MNQFTAEIFKKDARVKTGEREVAKIDFEVETSKESLAKSLAKDWPAKKGFRFEIFDTFVTKKNLLNGKEFQERYDTPYYCSPSSETYWSM